MPPASTAIPAALFAQLREPLTSICYAHDALSLLPLEGYADTRAALELPLTRWAQLLDNAGAEPMPVPYDGAPIENMGDTAPQPLRTPPPPQPLAAPTRESLLELARRQADALIRWAQSIPAQEAWTHVVTSYTATYESLRARLGQLVQIPADALGAAGRQLSDFLTRCGNTIREAHDALWREVSEFLRSVDRAGTGFFTGMGGVLALAFILYLVSRRM